MKKFKKIVAMCLAVVMSITALSVSVSANEETEGIKFVVTDENGNVVEVIEPIYLESVAEEYEQSKMQRWSDTVYYDLSSGAYTMSGTSAMIVRCSKHFNANSSGRLYYHGEVSNTMAYLNIYDKTNAKYVGTFDLRDQGNGTYLRSGYITGLSSSSSNYYSFSLSSPSGSFTSYYAAVSWTSL